LGCTDPRPRIAPPSVQILVSKTIHVTSPGNFTVSIYAYDVQGLDRLAVSFRNDSTSFQTDSTYFFTSTNEQTMNVVWSLPPGIPYGAQITLVAKVFNVIGFASSDTLFLPVLR
jgi:hypothetical protein